MLISEPAATVTATTAGPAGLAWMDNGQSIVSGPLLALMDRLDRAFLRLAGVWGASEYRFPTFIPAAELDRIDYFRSFPHLATFPVCLDPDDANMADFVDGQAVDGDGELRLTRLQPIRDVLTPAACYHFYVHLQGADLDRPRYLTTRNTCFRRETHYLPLERQWAFSMREIVAIGTLAEVRAFLERTQSIVSAFMDALGLAVAWETATDPFFRPSANPMYLSQRLNPTKQEAMFDGHLAIASVNLHQDHFGATYGISRDGEDATSGCVAFGVERWLYAVTGTFGPDPANWPDDRAVEAAAELATQ